MYRGERFNSLSHLVGAVLAVLGLILLLVFAGLSGNAWKIVSAAIYGTTLVIMYAFSTIYHSIRHPAAKNVLRRFDYISIYLLIAGTYTPFSLVTLHGPWGWTLFGLIWALAIFGIIQEVTFNLHSQKRLLSLIIYVLMGWLVLFALKPLIVALPSDGLYWLAAGGLIYSVGVYFFVNDERIPRYHSIWHVFVLVGSICQYISVLFYVI